MKVLHIAPTPFFADRGCHMRILGEVTQLNALGSRTLIVTYHNGRDIANLDVRRIVNIPWYKKLEAGGSWHKLYLDLLLLFESLRSFHKFRPDVIHGHLHEGALIGWLVKSMNFWHKKPLIFDVQGSLSGELEAYGLIHESSMLMTFFTLVERIICKLPDYFVCSSESNAALVKSFIDADDRKVSTVPDGIDPFFFKNQDNNTLRQIFNIPSSKKIVIYTGSLMRSKGVNHLINAIPLVLNRYKNAHFVLVGHPVEEWMQKTKQLQIDDFVDFTGKTDFFDLPKYLCSAEVAVDPKMSTSGEGSGKIMNYMGAGLPVVCFDTANNRSILGKHGIYARGKDKQHLADKIIYMLENTGMARRIGLENQRRAIDKFSWQASGESLKTIYESLFAIIQT